MLLVYNALVYDSSKKNFFLGGVLCEGEKIIDVFRGKCDGKSADIRIDAEGMYLVPGLVDIHTHGRAGGDFSTADKTLMTEMAQSYLLSGVTTVMPTLASAPIDELRAAIENINAVCAVGGKNNIANIAGVHLEGRYLNPSKRGAHAPELLSRLDADELEYIIKDISGHKHISAALELDESGEFLSRAKKLGATVGLGHTSADFQTAKRLISEGVTSMTHLFNAMPPLHHRDGGAVAAGLLSDAYCELICDGFHVSEEMVSLVSKLLIPKERLVLITDSMEATGCPDGEYTIAGMPVTVTNGKARTHDGAIAGSTLTLLDGVKNLSLFAEISFEDALFCATATPARAMKMYDDIGSIDISKRADMLLLDKDHFIVSVICGGMPMT